MKNLVNKFITYSFGNVLQSAFSLLLLPLYLRYFSPSEYGAISVLTVIQSFLVLVMSGGAVNGLIRLYFGVDGDRKKKLAGTTLTWYAATAIFGWCLLFFLARPLSLAFFQTDQHAPSFRLLAFVYLPAIMLNFAFYVLRLESKAWLFVLFSLFNLLVDIGLKLYLIVIAKQGIDGYFLAGAISGAFTLAAMIPVVLRYVTPSLHTADLKQLLRIGAPFIASGCSMWTLDVSDRLLLARFSGEDAVGIYSLAYNFANLFGIVLATPVALLIDPFFFAHAGEKSDDENKLLLRRMLIYYGIAGGALYLVIAVGSGELLRLFTTSFGSQARYLEAVRLLPVITLAPYMYFLASQAGYSSLLIKRPEIVSVAFIVAAVVNVGLNLVVIPHFGAVGAALTTVIAYLVLGGLAYYWMERLFPVGYDWMKIARLAGYVALAFAAGWLVRFEQPLVSLFAKLATSLAIFGILSFSKNGLLTNDERRMLMSKILRKA